MIHDEEARNAKLILNEIIWCVLSSSDGELVKHAYKLSRVYRVNPFFLAYVTTRNDCLT